MSYSYHSSGSAKSKASSGAGRRDEFLEWSLWQSPVGAGWLTGRFSLMLSRMHSNTQTRTHAHSHITPAHLLPTGLAQWGKIIPPTSQPLPQQCSVKLNKSQNSLLYLQKIPFKVCVYTCRDRKCAQQVPPKQRVWYEVLQGYKTNCSFVMDFAQTLHFKRSVL